MTLQLAVGALLCGSLFGFALAMAKVSSVTILRVLAYGIANLFRGLPELLTILIVYFGVQQLLNSAFDGKLEISAFTAGLVSLSLVFGAYSSEVFRAAYDAVPPGQIEAGKAFGMPAWLVMRRIHFPQLIKIAIPSLGNLWLVLLKDTSLVAVIGLDARL